MEYCLNIGFKIENRKYYFDQLGNLEKINIQILTVLKIT